MKHSITRWVIVEADGQIARDSFGADLLYDSECSAEAERLNSGERVVRVEITWDDGKGERCNHA